MLSQNQLTEQTLGNLLDFQTICPVYTDNLLHLYFAVPTQVLKQISKCKKIYKKII